MPQNTLFLGWLGLINSGLGHRHFNLLQVGFLDVAGLVDSLSLRIPRESNAN
jgi:hypothetical protein